MSYKNGYEANNDRALKIIQIIKEAMYLLNAATRTTCIVIALGLKNNLCVSGNPTLPGK